MSVSFQCPSCGRKYVARDELAGKRARCKPCGTTIPIPARSAPPPALDVFGLAEEPPRVPAEDPYADTDAPAPRRTSEGTKKKKKKARGMASILATIDTWPGGRPVYLSAFGVVGLVLVVLAASNLVVTFRWMAFAGFLGLVAAGAQALIATFRQGILAVVSLLGALLMTPVFLVSFTGSTRMGPLEAGVTMAIGYGLFFSRMQRREHYRGAFLTGLVSLLLIAPTVVLIVAGFHAAAVSAASRGGAMADIRLPIQSGVVPSALRFPDLGPGREIESGVVFRELTIPERANSISPAPAASGKLWLYLPAGEHAARSLPTVLITGAGSNLLSGMNLAEGDRAEHLPYVRAGFAVLAYELDGMLTNRDNPRDGDIRAAGMKFLAAKAGIVNAAYAKEFLLAKVPEADPGRLFAAGHSSAGTMALLFAANEPRIKGCVAYAPETDYGARFSTVDLLALRGLGLYALATTYDPRGQEGRISCPVLLFHARDDTNVPVARTEACAGRLRAMGKQVTLEVVPTGGHYDSMVREGIPRGVAWLRRLAGLDPKAR